MNTKLPSPNTLKTISRLFLLLILVLSSIHLWHGLRRYADFDEFQTLCNAANAFRGLELYKDFWDNHGPLATWFFQPFFYLNSTSHQIILLLRIVMWLFTLSGCYFLWRLGRLLYPGSSILPGLAVVFLLAAPPYLFKSVEIRGDNLANILGMAGLYLVCSGLVRDKALGIFFGGLCVGAIAIISLKVLLVIIAYGIIVGSLCIELRRMPKPKQVCFFLTGTGIPIIIASLWVDAELFYLCVIKANTSRAVSEVSASEIVEVFKKAPVWSVLAASSLLVSGLRCVKTRTLNFEAGCVFAVVILLAQFVFLLPTKNMQSLLPLYAPLALLAAINGAHFVEKNLFKFTPYLLTGGFILVIALLYRDLDHYCKLDNKELPRQVQFADQVLQATKQEPYVYDPAGIVFLKPKPGQFHVLVTFLRDGYMSGEINLNVRRMLKENSINSVVYSKRIATLPADDLAYITGNYTPVHQGPDTLLLQRNPVIPVDTTLEESGTYSKWRKKKREEKDSDPQLPADFDWFTRYRELTR